MTYVIETEQLLTILISSHKASRNMSATFCYQIQLNCDCHIIFPVFIYRGHRWHFQTGQSQTMAVKDWLEVTVTTAAGIH